MGDDRTLGPVSSRSSMVGLGVPYLGD